jgi:ATP phosphoribosyltransferase
MEVVLTKPSDVITYVEHGVCDIGIVGKDTIMEYGRSFYEVVDLGFGKCRFSLAAPKGKNFYDGFGVKTIATKYTNVAKQFCKQKALNARIVKVEGSVELAPLIGLSDGVIDLVETGKTLEENNLEVVEDIADITARVIVNIASMKLNKRRIEEFLKRVEKSTESGV